jgi:hypothetical protein
MASSEVCFLSKDQIFWILFFRAGNAAIVIGLDTEQKFGIFYVAFFGTGLQTWILHF